MVKIRIWKKNISCVNGFFNFFFQIEWNENENNLSTTTKGIEPRKKNIQTKNISRIFCKEKKQNFPPWFFFFFFEIFPVSRSQSPLSSGHILHHGYGYVFFFVVGWQNLRWSRNRICRMCDNNNTDDDDDGLCIFSMPNKKKCPDSPQRWSMNIPSGGADLVWMNEPRLDVLACIKLIIITNRLNWLIQLKSIHDYWCHWSLFILFSSMRWLNIGQDQIHDFQYLTLK